jgi:ABC-2 type transport system permease protein
MTRKELKARYKGAVFGFLWMFLNPLIQMAIIGFIFQFVTRIPIENYFLFLFAGLLPWNFFSYTITKTTSLIINERNLIKKAQFPRETIILALILANALNLIITLVLFIVILFGFGISTINLPILFLALLWLIGITTGFSLLASSWNVKFRDVNFFVQALTPLWFYATPILYGLDFIPEKFYLLLYLNPLTGIVELFKFSLLGINIASPPLLKFSILSSFIIIILGVISFSKQSKYFDDWV